MPNTEWKPNTVLGHAVEAAGFAYDTSPAPEGDLIFSRKRPWQRTFGYAWPMDVAAPAIGCVIDCEPIYFQWDGHFWMIELWKGQYGLERGGEIGIYRTRSSKVIAKVTERFDHFFPAAGKALKKAKKKASKRINPQHRFYEVFEDCEWRTSFILKDRGRDVVIRRSSASFEDGRHWWLTGFRWGEFVEDPNDLVMEATIRCPRRKMFEVVAEAFHDRGYTAKNANFRDDGEHTFTVTYRKPTIDQPWDRSRLVIRNVIEANGLFVEKYNSMRERCGITTNDPNEVDRKAREHIRDVTVKETYDEIVRYFTEVRIQQDKWGESFDVTSNA